MKALKCGALLLGALLMCGVMLAGCDVRNDREERESTKKNEETVAVESDSTGKVSEETVQDNSSHESDVDEPETGEADTEESVTDEPTTEEPDTEPPHEHSFGEWSEDKAATCTEKGSEKRTCACGELESREVEAKGHTEVTDAATAATCTETGLTEGKHCSVCNTVIKSQEVVAAKGHNYVDKVCTNCQKLAPSEGLAFISNGDGTCFISGIGNCTDDNVVIPSVSPTGDIVVSIGNKAFFQEHLTSITLPNSIKIINESAFLQCFVETVVLGEEVTAIQGSAFMSCMRLENIYIPNTLKKIGPQAFHDCKSLKNVYYAGSEEEWEKISISSLYNGALKNATMHYNVPFGGENSSFVPHRHIWSDWKVIKTASCSAKGVKERVCECGKKEEQTIEKTPHSEVIDPAISPTCTSYGLTEGIHCAVCNSYIVMPELIDPIGHDFGEWVTIKESTCITNGRQERVCHCGAKDTKQLNKIAHAPVNDEWKYDSIYHWKVCSCGKILEDSGHVLGDWTVVTEATETTEGSKWRVCNECDYKETKVIPTPLKMISQPKSFSTVAFQNASATVKWSGGQAPYDLCWQIKNGDVWEEDRGSGHLNSATSYTFKFKQQERGQYMYRCVITDSEGNSVMSDICTITVYNPPEISCSKSISASCDSTATISVTIKKDPLDNTIYSYSWIRQDSLGSSSGRVISNNSQYSGATTSTLKIKTKFYAETIYYTFNLDGGSYYQTIKDITLTVK